MGVGDHELGEIEDRLLVGGAVASGSEQIVDGGVELVGLGQAGGGFGGDALVARHREDLESHRDTGDAGS